MPSEAVHGFRYPTNGLALLYKDGLVVEIEGEEEDSFDCQYHIDGDSHICFGEGWTDFTAVTNIGETSVLLIKVEPFQEHIGLKFVEIIN